MQGSGRSGHAAAAGSMRARSSRTAHSGEIAQPHDVEQADRRHEYDRGERGGPAVGMSGALRNSSTKSIAGAATMLTSWLLPPTATASFQHWSRQIILRA